MTLCLSPDEIEELTQKKRYSAQIRVLRALGIESRPRPDGSILVDRRHYESWANGGKERRAREKTEPRWNA